MMVFDPTQHHSEAGHREQMLKVMALPLVLIKVRN